MRSGERGEGEGRSPVLQGYLIATGAGWTRGEGGLFPAPLLATWLRRFRQILFDCSFCGKIWHGKSLVGRQHDSGYFVRCKCGNWWDKLWPLRQCRWWRLDFSLIFFGFVRVLENKGEEVMEVDGCLT